MLRLEGMKIVLRGGRDKDIAPMYRYICDPAVTRYLALVPPESEQQFGESLKHMITAERDYFFIIANKTDNSPMGLIRLHWKAANVGEVSYWLGREHWGKGYAAEAIGKLGVFAFTELGLDEIIAHCYAGNTRSITLLQGLGFEVTGAHDLVDDDPRKRREVALRVHRHGFLWKDPAQAPS